jgi:hypothetical protein
VVGSDGAVFHFDGVAWKRTLLPPGSDRFGDDPVFHAVVGTSETNVFIADERGEFYHFEGAVWSPVPNPYRIQFQALWASPTGRVFAFGEPFPFVHVYQR